MEIMSLQATVLFVSWISAVPALAAGDGPVSDKKCASGQWQCESGECVAAAAVCDGELQCGDSSDEYLTRCTGTRRPLFGLVLHCSQPWSRHHDALCPQPCRRWPHFCYYALAGAHGLPGACVLPAFPRVGSYDIEDIVLRSDGVAADFSLVYSCPPHYTLVGSSPRCVKGTWIGDFPTCKSECGIVTSQGESLRKRRHVTSKRGELPWHAGIYSKLYQPYKQICGGTLVSTTVVISAGHCFWGQDKIMPANDYAVGVGKIYRAWNFPEDGQKTEVRDIRVPPRFWGQDFQDDVSLVFLAKPVHYTFNVVPICIDFNVVFDERQLQPGNIGKVGGWGLTSEDGEPSPVLKVLEVSYVDVSKCITDVPLSFRSYITSDKICASVEKGSTICKGDSGGGLAFPNTEQGDKRWYLRGVVSTAPANEHKCNVETSYITFTQLQKHVAFVRKHLDRLH